jgi:hypothetical protein
MSEPLQNAVVVRGAVDSPDGSDENFERKGRAASWARIRRYYPGQIVTLPAADFLRLQKLGVVRAR